VSVEQSVSLTIHGCEAQPARSMHSEGQCLASGHRAAAMRHSDVERATVSIQSRCAALRVRSNGDASSVVCRAI
jgi:hypothetical protein